MGTKVVSELLPFDGKYYTAEEYHQQYLQKGGQDASKGAWVQGTLPVPF